MDLTGFSVKDLQLMGSSAVGLIIILGLVQRQLFNLMEPGRWRSGFIMFAFVLQLGLLTGLVMLSARSLLFGDVSDVERYTEQTQTRTETDILMEKY